MTFKHFTILHTNDIHGDILPEIDKPSNLDIGGLSLLSGYLKQVREKEKNVIFTISGDMLQGSLIDTEYKGISTIEILNYLGPDVASIGNHDIDYGLAHLLFLEKIASFPIVNANLYIQKYQRRLMRPYTVLTIDGYKILFIGIVTPMILEFLKSDHTIGPMINLEDPSLEIAKVCDAFKMDDVDLTVLLTHIGFENDKKLAALLDPSLGVDLILGGHSHTALEQPVLVNDILIAQSGSGTNQIGRFDIIVNKESNRIVEWKWELAPVDSNHCSSDKGLEEFVNGYNDRLNGKFNALVGRCSKALTHERHAGETPLGNLVADILNQCAENDLTLVSSAFIRGDTLGPVVSLGDLHRIFPYNETLYRVLIPGNLLKRIINNIFLIENRMGDSDSFQVNRAVKIIFNDSYRMATTFTINGESVQDNLVYNLGIHSYIMDHCRSMIGISQEELLGNHEKQITLNTIRDVIEEYLRIHHNLHSEIEGRIVLKE